MARTFALVLVAALGPLAAQKVGEDAPDIVWSRTFGFGDIAAGKLSDLRGSVVLLEFFETEGTASRKHAPQLEVWHSQKAEAGLVVIGVSADSTAQVEAWIKKVGADYPIALSKTTDYVLSVMPHALLIDKDGKVAWRGQLELLDEPTLDKTLVGARPAIVVAGLEDVQVMRRAKDFGAAYGRAKQLLAGTSLSERAQAQAKDWVQQYEQFVQDAIAAADKAVAAKDVFAQWAALQPAADWYQGVPGADVCKTRFDALLAVPTNKKEIEAGRKLATAKVKEAAFDFDGAYAICKEVAAAFGTTKAGRDAAALIKAYEKDGKLGYDHTCGYCKAGGSACPQHRKKKK
ncbi:MAG: TlpA disulfide reductase family protein [Planctomycetota bacterium]